MIRFGGGQRSGNRKVVGDRATFGDGAETVTLGDDAVCTVTLGGAEGTGAGRATSVDGKTEVDFWLKWSKMWDDFWMMWS